MSDDNTHSVAIGGFVLGGLLIAVVTVLFVLGSGLGGGRDKVIMAFDSSVKGLSVGAPVALRGVEIGQVTAINLMLDSEETQLIMLVEAQISSANIQRENSSADQIIDHLIHRGLRAQLNLQSLLTGLLYISLDFHPDTPAQLSDIDSPYTQIPTIPTGLEKLTRQIESLDIARIATDVQRIAAGLSTFIEQDDFRQLPQQLTNNLASLELLSEDLRATVAIVGPGLEAVLTSTDLLVSDMGDELPRISATVTRSLVTVQAATDAFADAMAEIDALVSSDSATTYQLNTALRELAQAAQALQLLAKTLEEQPESLLRGKSRE